MATIDKKCFQDFMTGFKDYNAAIETKFKKMEDIIASLQVAACKGAPAVGAPRQHQDFLDIKSVAFGEMKTATVSNPASGGIGSVPSFQHEVIKLITDVNPLYADAHKVTIDGNMAEYIKQVARPSAQWVGETEERTSSDAQYAPVSIPLNKVSACVSLSKELLSDANWINVESDLLFQTADQIGDAMAKAILSGDGSKKPLGITNTPGVNIAKSGASKSFTVKALRKAMAQVPIPFQNGCKWYMDMYSLGVIEETYKDSHVVTRGIGDSPSTMLFGRPVELMDFGTTNPLNTSGAVCALYGNMTYYDVPIKGGMEIERDETDYKHDIVKFWSKARIGGQLIQPKAFTVIEEGAE